MKKLLFVGIYIIFANYVVLAIENCEMGEQPISRRNPTVRVKVRPEVFNDTKPPKELPDDESGPIDYTHTTTTTPPATNPPISKDCCDELRLEISNLKKIINKLPVEAGQQGPVGPIGPPGNDGIVNINDIIAKLPPLHVELYDENMKVIQETDAYLGGASLKIQLIPTKVPIKVNSSVSNK